MSEKAKKSGKNFMVQGSILAIAGVITKIIGAVYRVPLVNILGDTGMGYYGVAFQIYAIVLTLTSYSLPLAVSKLISARVATKEYRNAMRVFRGALTFAFVVGGTACLILFFGADFIAENIMAMKYSAIAMRVLAPCVLIVAVMGVFRGFFQGNGSMIPTAFSQVLEQVVNAVASIAGAYFLLKLGKNIAKKRGVHAYSYAYAAAGGTVGTVMGAAIALAFLVLIFLAFRKVFQKKIKRERRGPVESYQRIFKILLITIAPVLISATVYNLCGVIDNSMYGVIMSAQGFKESEYASYLGILSGKYDTVINVPLAFSNALAASLIPSLVATVKTGSRKQVHRKINTFAKFDMMIAIPSAVGLIVLAKPVLDLLFFTEDNKEAALILQLGAISVIFYCLSTVTNAVLQGLDKMMIPVRNAAIALVVHVVALFIMMVVFKWGIYAVVVSKIVFSACTCILNSHSLRDEVGYVQEQKKTFVIPGISALIMGIVAKVVHLLFELFAGTQIATLIALPIAAIAYGTALILLGGVTEAELKTVPKGRVLISFFKKIHVLK